MAGKQLIAGNEELLEAQLRVLQGISHAFGAIRNVSDAERALHRWLKNACGDDTAKITIFLGDSADLRNEIAIMDADAETALRDQLTHVMNSKRPLVVPNELDKTTAATFPLMSHGEWVGALELVASSAALTDRWKTVKAVVSQFAILLRNLRDHRDLEFELKRLASATELVSSVVGAGSPIAALDATLTISRSRHEGAIAVWLRESPGDELRLIDARGLSREQTDAIIEEMSDLPLREEPDDQEITRLAGHFALLCGIPNATAFLAGSALLMVGDPSTWVIRWLEEVTPKLSRVLDHLAIVTDAKSRSEELDMGLAWTAHELRAPLLAVKSAIEQVIGSQAPQWDSELLVRSKSELDHLGELVESLLRWSVTNERPQSTPMELSDAVDAAIASCAFDAAYERVIVDRMPGVVIDADPKHIQVAVANLVRNALNYSPPESKVTVAVKTREDLAVLSVQDEGPGIPAHELPMLFDPLMRGSSGSRANGKGLGLYIVARVAEAHGGRAWVESSDGGATFYLSLPLSSQARLEVSA